MQNSCYRTSLLAGLILIYSCGADTGDPENDGSTEPHQSTQGPTAPISSEAGGSSRTSQSAKATRTIDTSGATALARPDPVCGEKGFAYLLQQYFYPHCSECHGLGSASADLNIAYPAMMAIDKETLLKVVLSGKFCTDECRLSPNDSTYLDIMEWQEQKSSCPSP